MPVFHEVLFPEDISYTSGGGPKFKTTVFMSDSGYEQRNIDWSNSRAEYDVSQGIKNQDQMDILTAFFYARRGKAYGFRFKDFNDYRIKQQVLGVGDGVKTKFQLIKTYVDGQAESGETYTYTRKITKPVWGTVAGVTVGVAVKVSPDDYEVDYSTGIITFFDPPGVGAVVKVGAAQFHVPVRFDTDQLDATHEFWNHQTWGSIPLVEVRDWTDVFA
ncbi:glycoside hydrolase [Caulobacter phage CcrBL9]|uniref:Gene transfer agent n=1 Tax=Caulobacter phage CcrBL9 TaxID=2283270 RepID=A0A385EBC2_9CAUD|nr:glycoside hydrolase [Caulobacter phage CcrBL9]AXQ69191.1 gene transfer agent [Caulobacter phage CcrBL9]